MRRITQLLGLLLAFCTASAYAALPFKTTTITSDGKFAEGTIWYTIQIGSGGLVIANNGTADKISLKSTSLTYKDAELWCFVGNATKGYRLYNKEAGAGKVLASPKTMSGKEGGSAYVALKDTAKLGTSFVCDWLFADSKNLGTDVNAQYMYQKGAPANKVNNRDNILAFWTGGADHGSSLKILFAETTMTVDANSGTFTQSNAGKTWHQVWTSKATNPQLTLNAGYNNMIAEGGNLVAYAGQYRPQAYTLSAGVNYRVTGFSFDFIAHKEKVGVVVSAGGQTKRSTLTSQSIKVEGLEGMSASFTLDAVNNGIVLSNFKVTLGPAIEKPEPQVNIFETKSGVPYRIPAIATAHNGDIIAVADYRHSGADIGMVNNGRIDLRARISKDNGKTWGNIFPIVEGKGASSPDFMNVGFGDPCIVADRESDRVLVMSCAGNVSFPNGKRNHHQCIARFYSDNNGKTWSKPVDISESIYSQFDNSKIGACNAMFIGSGRIFQSSTVKVDQYYRIYCSVLYKDVNGVNKNYVLFSDNFGDTWGVLGGVDVAPIPSGADEPKVEELPDGSILVSSRAYGGRNYNIFNFTDSKAATGSWGTMAFSGVGNKGVVATGNSTNGEVLILPVRRASDNKPVYLALQSVPFGSGRANVGIYYKELASLSDFVDASAFAKNWPGKHQASRMFSAYSTMTLQKDSTIGFLYEEETFGKAYTIVYKNYSVEYITDSLYTYDPTVVPSDVVPAGIDSKYKLVKTYFGKAVGNIDASSSASADVEAAYNAYKADPTKDNYERFNKSYMEAPCVALEAGKCYRLRNVGRAGNPCLVGTATGLSASALSKANKNQLFSFEAAADGNWYVKCDKANTYVGKMPAASQAVPVQKKAEFTYVIASTRNGRSTLACAQPTAGAYPAIHLDGGNKLVAWDTGAEASQWFIEPTDDIPTGIVEVDADDNTPEVVYDLQGRRVEKLVKGGVYVTSKRRKIYVK